MFIAIRNGQVALVKQLLKYKGWAKNIMYKARGDKNYRGESIEHIICQEKIYDVVEAADFQPDSQDFKGEYPLFYTMQADDVLMIRDAFKVMKYKRKGRIYPFLLA